MLLTNAVRARSMRIATRTIRAPRRGPIVLDAPPRRRLAVSSSTSASPLAAARLAHERAPSPVTRVALTEALLRHGDADDAAEAVTTLRRWLRSDDDDDDEHEEERRLLRASHVAAVVRASASADEAEAWVASALARLCPSDDDDAPSAFRPTLALFAEAAAARGREGAPERAEAAVTEAVARYGTTGDDDPAARYAFNVVLAAYARAGRAADVERVAAAMPSRDAYSYAALCDALRRTAPAGAAGDAVERAVARARRRDGVVHVVLLNHLLAARRADGDAARAARAFERAARAYAAGDGNLRPDVVGLNTVLGALADVGEGARAEAVLNRAEELGVARPDADTYHAVSRAHARAGDARAARALLRRMEEDDAAPSPDATTYRIVMSAHVDPAEARRFFAESARADADLANELLRVHARAAPNDPRAAPEATSFLERMIDDDDHRCPPPDLVSFRAVVDAWARSDAPDKAGRARAVSREAARFARDDDDERARRSLRDARRGVLAACVGGGVDALAIAVDVLDEAEAATPDAATYAAFLRVCHAFRRRGGDVDFLVGDAVRSCRDRGLVDGRVWRETRRAASVRLWRDLVAGVGPPGRDPRAIAWTDLPPEWRRNTATTTTTTEGR